MVVKIEKPRSSTKPVLDYNEKKFLAGNASLVGYANLEDTSMKSIYSTFERIERSSRYPVEKVSFHASVNPSSDDTCTEQQIFSFIEHLICELGLKNQPVLVYRHNDIEREHYHIVSILIDKEGHKISTWHNYNKVQALMKKLGPECGFSVGKIQREDDIRHQIGVTGDFVLKHSPIERFNPKKEVLSQMQTIFQQAAENYFETPGQFVEMMKDYGVQVLMSPGYVALQGLDGNDKPCTAVFNQDRFPIDLLSLLERKICQHESERHNYWRERDRVTNLVRFAFENSNSEGHFAAILRNKGISVHLYRTENGRICGATFVDLTTRCVFSATQLSNTFKATMMQEAIDSGRWRIERPQKKASARAAAIAEARAKAELAILARNTVGTLAAVLPSAKNDYAPTYDGRGANDEPEEKPTTDGPVIDDIMGGMRIRLD